MKRKRGEKRVYFFSAFVVVESGRGKESLLQLFRFLYIVIHFVFFLIHPSSENHPLTPTFSPLLLLCHVVLLSCSFSLSRTPSPSPIHLYRMVDGRMEGKKHRKVEGFGRLLGAALVYFFTQLNCRCFASSSSYWSFGVRACVLV